MKKLPLSIQTFRDFIEQDYIYVDKTKPIHDLFARGGKYFFLSRPRRFGKSLLISTLAEIFSGNKELFKGLWIYDKIEWTPYPVIHMDFSTIDYTSPKKFKESIKKFLNKTAISHSLTLDEEKSDKESFVELIEKLSAKGRVVILIDEYDKPLIEYIEAEKIETAREIRQWYNGYSWDGKNFVYNPFSILNLFTESRFGNYWFSSGTPTFLIKSIKRLRSEIREFENLPVKSYIFDCYDIESMNIAALLFQTGYLTIKQISIADREETYHLSYPNKEVRDSFLTYLFGEYSRNAGRIKN